MHRAGRDDCMPIIGVERIQLSYPERLGWNGGVGCRCPLIRLRGLDRRAFSAFFLSNQLVEKLICQSGMRHSWADLGGFPSVVGGNREHMPVHFVRP